MKIIDLHCDTLVRCFLQGEHLSQNSGHIDLEKLKKGKALAQVFALFLPTEGTDVGKKRLGPYEMFKKIYPWYQEELRINDTVISEARSVEEILQNSENGKISSVLAVEDGALLENKLSRLDELYQKGVRLLTLLWNQENCIGYPNSDNEKEHQKGLKEFGLEVVDRMNQLGMLIDVSHLSEGGFWDVAAHSRQPFVASHSCVSRLCGHSRNLNDEQLKGIAECGGIVGVNFNSFFLMENSSMSTIQRILEHIDYVLQKAGEESVALGSDFDGIFCELEMKDYGEYGKLTNALLKKYSTTVVEKICFRNALRVMKDVENTAQK